MSACRRGMRNQHGIALVIVMWLIVLLTVIAADFLYAMRSETAIARNALSQAKAQAAADAAVHRAVFDLFKFNPTQDEVWRRDGQWHEWAFEGATGRVRLLDESGKIDINSARSDLLKGLFTSNGLDDEKASKLVAAIEDWRDGDVLTRPNGAEEPEYRAAGLKYKPANAAFQSIEELRLVLGMTQELFQQISGIITVYTRQNGINTQFAERRALLAIPGATAEIVDKFIADRDAARAAKTPIPAFPVAGAPASAGFSLAVSVRADIKLEDGTQFVREAVVKTYPGDAKRPYAFLAWREGGVASPAQGAVPGVAQ